MKIRKGRDYCGNKILFYHKFSCLFLFLVEIDTRLTEKM